MSQYIDMHCDTLMIAYLTKQPDIYKISQSMVDFERMQKGQAMAQCFAIFMPPEEMFQYVPLDLPKEDDRYIQALAAILRESTALHPDLIGMAYHAEDIRNHAKEGKMSAVLTIEDGRAVNGSLEKIDAYYNEGVRMMALTWNSANCFGEPNSKDPAIMQKGLTDFGKEAVCYMQEKGMIVDVSHLSDGGFFDVASLAKKPFVASHSNCRSVCPHQRNLTDEMIRILAEHGGVMGINFAPEFLNADCVSKESTVERMVLMAQHAKKVGGIEVVALGSDMDGIEGQLEIGSSDKMQILADGLSKAGFTAGEIDKIFYQNTLRVFEDTL